MTTRRVPAPVADPVTPIRTVLATRYVAPLREGGSLPGLIEADDDGMYVLKFRGAGQGPKALIAEILAARIGLHLGLPIPEPVLVELEPSLGKAEPDPEIHDLLVSSAGINAGLDFLPGSLPFSIARSDLVSSTLASEIVWFDAFMMNMDRSVRNPNLLLWHDKLWLIDHGAALYVHHAPGGFQSRFDAPFPQIRDHILLPLADDLAAVADRYANSLSESDFEAMLGPIPDDWLTEGADDGADALRAIYVAFLAERLAARESFVKEAIRART